MKRPIALYALAGALLAAYAVLLIVNSVFQNDELQHLHVVWSWTRGLVQYKDVFDNHAPLYHLLTALLVSALGLGASPDLVVYARFLSLPFFIGVLALVYKIGRRVFGLEAGDAFLTACLAGLTAPFIAMAARPEPAWVFLFFASVLLFSGGEFSARKGFYAGLLNGAGAAVSLKTLVLLLPAQVLAASAFHFFYRKRFDWKFAAAFAAGLAAVPLLTASYFLRLGAFSEMRYYTLSYNSSGAPFDPSFARLGAAALAAAGAFLGLRSLKERTTPGMFVFVSIPVFLGLLLILFPVREEQTMLPFLLLVYTLAAGLLVKYGARALPEKARPGGLFSVFAVLLMFQLYHASAFADGNAEQRAGLRRLLSLAREGEYLMDAKGESVFGRRPFYYGLELLAMKRMAAGEIEDTIPERMQATGTKLVLLWLPGRFTRKDLDFIYGNYLPLDGPGGGGLLGAGMVVGAGEAEAGFEIKIPAEYYASCVSGAGSIFVDGKIYRGKPLPLESGSHTLRSRGCEAVRFMWNRVEEAGRG